MKVWHDDHRRPPSDEWEWARTNAEAQELLQHNDVTHISLDHDLGLHEVDPDAELEDFVYIARPRAETGLDLVHWMIEYQCVPRYVTIHSWNPSGAAYMAARLNQHGYDCVIAPFKA